MKLTNYQSNGKNGRRKYFLPSHLSPITFPMPGVTYHLSPITYFLALCLMVIGCGRAMAQGGTTTVGGGTIIPTGASLPATCDPTLAGDSNHYFYKTAAPNQGLYSCTATNTWSAGGSGPANAAIKPATGDSVIYLSTAGNDSNDGLSWGTAKLTLAGALATVAAGGGTIYVGKGAFPFSTGVSTTINSLRIIGSGLQATVFNYTGSGANVPALQIGNSSGFTHGCDLEDFEVTLNSAANTAIGIKLQQPFTCLLKDIGVETVKGTAGTSQIALQCDGTGGFGNYLVIANPFVSGDFKKGYDITGTGALNGCNTTQIVGGSIVNTSSPRATGTIGLHIEDGDTNRVWDTDFEGWDVGVQTEANANANGPIAIRLENNNTPWKVQTNSTSNSFMGSSWLGTPVDNGIQTIYQSAINGGTNLTSLWATQINSTLNVIGPLGFVASVGAAPDNTITRLGANTLGLNSWLQNAVSFGNQAFSARASNVGDTFDRWYVSGGGAQNFGPGNAATDTVLQRGGLADLQTTGQFDVKRLTSNQASTLAAGDFSLSAGWGAGATVTSITGHDQANQFTVTAAGTPSANPTITLTFHDGTWTTVPVCLVQMNGGAGVTTTQLTWTPSATTNVITFNGTPVATKTYVISQVCVGI